MLNIYNAPVASASMGGLPSLHGQSHSVGGTDPIPELLTIGNRLTPAEWNGDSGSALPINCTLSYAAGEIQATAATTSIGVGWAGGAAAGKVSVQPGQIVTATALASIKSAAAARNARMRIYFWNATGGSVAGPQGSTVVIPLGGAWVELRYTTVAPAGAALTSCFVNIAPVVAGEVFALKQPAFWFGAGGVAQSPGLPIHGLGFQRRSPLGGADMVFEQWDGAAWIPITYDSGWCDISTLLEPGWVGTVLVRRTLTDLTVQVAPIKYTAAATSDVFWKPPSGWGYPPGVMTGGPARYGSIPDGSSATRWAAVTSSNLGLCIQRGVGNTVADVNHWGSVIGPVTSALPTVLPGVQMFDSSEAIVLPASG